MACIFIHISADVPNASPVNLAMLADMAAFPDRIRDT